MSVQFVVDPVLGADVDRRRSTRVGFACVYRGFHHPTAAVVGYVLECAVLLVAVLGVRTWSLTNQEEALR